MLPALYSIHKSKVSKVMDFGAFVALEGFLLMFQLFVNFCTGYSQQGLIPVSQLMFYRVEKVYIPFNIVNVSIYKMWCRILCIFK